MTVQPEVVKLGREELGIVMSKWILAALAVSAFCGEARAADTGNQNTGDWIEPKYDALKAGWPRDAQGQLVYGEVKLDCGVGPNGVAADCKVKSSTPANAELEQAALKLSSLYKARTPKTASRAMLEVDVRYDELPDWQTKPTFDQLMAVFPADALRRGISGTAVIKCVVQTNGLPRACTVVKEDRPDIGFGPAALVLSRTFLFRPATKDGKPVEAEITIPINFATQGSLDVTTVKVLDTAIWSKTPTVAEILAEIDKKVGDKFADGQVVFQCRLEKTTGKLNGCVLANASPGMAQFKDVARSLTPKFQADPAAMAKIQNNNIIINLAFAFPDMSSPDWNKRYLTHPRWVRTISPDVDKATFPEAAAKAGLKTGKATVDCIASANGALTKCTVVSESTPNLGFGEMAIQIAQTFAANPWNEDGLPVDGAHVRMPIQMDYTPPEPAAAPTPATKP